MLTTILKLNKKAVVTNDTKPNTTAGFKHSTSVGALVMSKRTSYDDLETLMQSGSPRALTPNHHSRNKSDPKSATSAQSNQPLALSDPRPALQVDEYSSSSDLDEAHSVSHIHVDPKEIKFTEQPIKKKKRGLFHRRHGSSNSDEAEQNSESLSALDQRSDHKKKANAPGFVKSAGTSNLYQCK